MSGVSPFACPEEKVRDVARRFEGVVGCWPWPQSCNPDTGYGQFNHRGTLYTAHRVSFAAFKGPIPEGAQVLHRCDNRPCFNPECLFAGTQLDNMRDMAAKGRQWAQQHPERVKRGAAHWNYQSRRAAISADVIR